MKKQWQKVLSVLMIVCLLACFAACTSGEDADESSKTGETVSVDPNAGYQVDGKWTPKIGVIDSYKGREFNVLVAGEGAATYQSDDFTTEAGSGGIDYGDTYYTEVKKRNQEIEEVYGVTLVVHKEDNHQSLAEQDAIAGTKLYDGLVLPLSTMTYLAQEGHLADLNTLKNFDVNAPWWDASANEAYSIGDKLYFSTGDITIMNKANVWSILFNKDMIKDYGLDNPYELFDNGTWTFDKMCEMAATVNNAPANPDYEDSSLVYGMITAYGDIVRFYGASGMTLCSKDSKNEPTLEFGKTESSINLTSDILSKINNANWKAYAEEVPGSGFQKSFEFFYTGRALFRPSGFTAVTKCRKLATIQFGIVPMPKMVEGQDEYYVTGSGSFVAGVLKTCSDPEFSAYMLDAYAAGAKNYITPAYVDTNLRTLSLRDDESEKCLDYIFDHIIYDVGHVYNFGGIMGMFNDLAKSGSSDVTSKFEGIKEMVTADIEDLVQSYEMD